jgi:osmoprotectant transport system ATP-binding protein
MIEFDNVSKVYPDGTVALRDVSFSIPSHAMVALVGSSGSGKTTLLRMINRMIEPTSGRILIDGTDISTMNPVRLRRSIGYVLQLGGLMPHRSVVDNIATVPVLNGVSKPQARDEALGLLDIVGLDRSVAHRFPGQLSGGQQQRVGVARALAADPNILLMDEPFGAVDPIVRRELQSEIKRLHEQLGKTIVFVTHDVDEAFALGQEVILLRAGGEIVQRGTPAELLTAPADDYVSDFVGATDPSRTLHIDEVDGRRLVRDTTGRLLGLIAP